MNSISSKSKKFFKPAGSLYIEVLVALFLLVTVTGAGALFFSQFRIVHQKTRSYSSIIQSANEILYRISNNIPIHKQELETNGISISFSQVKESIRTSDHQYTESVGILTITQKKIPYTFYYAGIPLIK